VLLLPPHGLLVLLHAASVPNLLYMDVRLHNPYTVSSAPPPLHNLADAEMGRCQQQHQPLVVSFLPLQVESLLHELPYLISFFLI
jgi:hypothetical protein